MPTYSHSKLGCYEQCGLKYKYKYIEKIETEVENTIEAFMGGLVHEALEKLYADLKVAHLLAVQDLVDFYHESWDAQWTDNIVIVKQHVSKEQYRALGERFIRDYYARYYPFNQAKTVALETQNMVPLDDTYMIHVRIDRLALTHDGVFEIHDYKTSNTLPKQDAMDRDRQLAIYAYGIKHMYPDTKDIKLIWHYLAFDTEMVSTRSDEEIEQLRMDVLRQIGIIEATSDFKANVSKLCDWCEYKRICPQWKHLYPAQETGVKLSRQEGVDLVRKFLEYSDLVRRNQEELENVRAKILEYASQQGVQTVFGTDHKVRIMSYPKLSFPKRDDERKDAFYTLLKKIGLWDSLAVPDTYELAKMLNNNEIHEELAKLLNQFIETEETTRVTLSKHDGSKNDN